MPRRQRETKAAAHPSGGRSALAGIFRFLRTTLVGGIVFLLPLVVLGMLLAKLGSLLDRLAKPLARWLPLNRVSGVLVADIVLIVLMVVLCFLAGLLAHVSFANRIVKRAEAGVLWRIPGYGLLKGITDGLDKSAATAAMVPVLIHFDDAAQLAFEVDQLADGRRVIYVPGAPDPRAGSVWVFEKDRVEPVPVTYLRAIAAFRALGRGIGPALSARGEV